MLISHLSRKTCKPSVQNETAYANKQNKGISNENCNKTNRVLSTCVQLQRILNVYLTEVMVVQVHGSVFSFIKSVSPSNPRTIKVVT